MLDIVCWLWKPAPEYRSQFSVEHVNTLRAMIARHYPHPHRFSVITDQSNGFDEGVRVIPLWDDFGDRESLYGPNTPSCYRRLKAYSHEMEKIIGSRFVSLDLDCVIVRDPTPLWHRTEDFVIWGDHDRRTPYNGSMWMMDAGARRRVWDKFVENPDLAIKRARGAGFYGTDQAWVCYILGPNEKRWTVQDGVFSYRMRMKNNGGALPKEAKIVFFEGHLDPWSPVVRDTQPWVIEHYK